MFGREPGGRPADVARIIFDAGAEAHFLHHFQIEFRAHLDALRFEQFAVRLEPRDAVAQFLADGQDARASFCLRRDELFRREKSSTASSDSILFPVNGSKRVMRSISSPKNSMRKPSSRPAGQTSTVSPRTRKLSALERDVVARRIADPRAATEIVRAKLPADAHAE